MTAPFSVGCNIYIWC